MIVGGEKRAAASAALVANDAMRENAEEATRLVWRVKILMAASSLAPVMNQHRSMSANRLKT